MESAKQERKNLMKDMPIDNRASGGSWMSKHSQSRIGGSPVRLNKEYAPAKMMEDESAANMMEDESAAKMLSPLNDGKDGLRSSHVARAGGTYGEDSKDGKGYDRWLTHRKRYHKKEDKEAYGE